MFDFKIVVLWSTCCKWLLHWMHNFEKFILLPFCLDLGSMLVSQLFILCNPIMDTFCGFANIFVNFWMPFLNSGGRWPGLTPGMPFFEGKGLASMFCTCQYNMDTFSGQIWRLALLWGRGRPPGLLCAVISPDPPVGSHRFTKRLRMKRILTTGYLMDISGGYIWWIYRVFFFTGPPPEKLKYGKPRLAEVRFI